MSEGLKFKCPHCERKAELSEYYAKLYVENKFLNSIPCKFCKRRFSITVAVKKYVFETTAFIPEALVGKCRCKNCEKRRKIWVSGKL